MSLPSSLTSKFTADQLAALLKDAESEAKKNAVYLQAAQLAQNLDAEINGRPIYSTEELRLLETQPLGWLSKLLPTHFRGEDQFAPHHRAFWEWVWPLERGQKPSPSAYLMIWARGGMKSTSTGGAAVSLGARNKRKYCLIVTRTQPQADGHVWNINQMLTSSLVSRHYPDMAKPHVTTVGNRKQQAAWNREQLTTASGFTVQGFGVESSLRGVRIGSYRPDLIIVTDIDSDKDSSGYVDTLLEHLAGSVLGTASDDCAIIFEQNLIHRDSVLNRVLTHKTDVLSDRIEGGPVPALLNPTYERRHERWFIMSGIPTWPAGMPLSVCEAKLNDWGRDKWDREAQHDVEKAYEDAIYSQWDERYHIITWSEFVCFFGDLARDKNGRPVLPHKGYVGFAQDWGNNPRHPCANRWVWTPAEGMLLTDSAFFYREMCWPRFPAVEQDERKGPSAVKVGKAIIEAEKEFRESWERPRTKHTDPVELETRVTFRLASHERPEIQEAYRADLSPPLMFESIDTAEAREGILRMQDFLTIIEDEPHPFRRYPEGHPQAGQPLQGRPRVYFIVDDSQGELVWDAAQQKLRVAPAVDERGMARTRFEYPLYRKPSTSEGAERKDPPKRDDDIIDTDRAIAGRLFLGLDPLTMEERVQLRLRVMGYDKPPLDPASEVVWYMSRDMQAQKLLREELNNSQPVYGIGHKIDYRNDPYALIRHQIEKAQQDLELLPDDVFGGGGF